MPRLISLISAGNDPLLLLISRWTAVVGRRNRKILFPKKLDVEKKTLRIAVPNSMVRAQYEPLLSLIVEKIAQVAPGMPVEKIVLSVEPRYFAGNAELTEPPVVSVDPAPEAVGNARQRLVEKGVSPRLATTLAHIEVMLEQNRDADK